MLLKKKRFGNLVSVSVRLRWCRLQEYYNDGWHGTWAQDGGVTNQQAIHHIDALTWICGNVKSVSAISAKRANELGGRRYASSCYSVRKWWLGNIRADNGSQDQKILRLQSLLPAQKEWCKLGE